MIRRILLCVDGSEHALAAAGYAGRIAAASGAAIEVLHVLDARTLEGPYIADIGGALGAQPYLALMPQMQSIQREKAGRVMEAVKERLGSLGVASEGRIVEGHLVPQVLEREKEADLVILGKHGEHAPYEVDMIGPSVEWIVRRSDKPCLVTPLSERRLERAMVAYDGSVHAKKALVLSFALARDLGLDLTVVTVCPTDDEKDHWKAVSGEAATLCRGAGVETQVFLRDGYPAPEIAQFISDGEFDLLVMGAYGHTRVREFLVGSTTFELLIRTATPVLLAR